MPNSAPGSGENAEVPLALGFGPGSPEFNLQGFTGGEDRSYVTLGKSLSHLRISVSSCIRWG